jgi:hypothetical protein
VNYGPRSILLHITFYCKHRLLSAIIYLLTANKYHFPHDMFNPLFLANQWDWQPHCKLEQSILVVLCAGSTLLLAPKLCPDKASSTNTLVPLPKSASNNLRKWFLSPTGRLNFGFITEGKLTVVLITPYSWGSQLVHAPAGPNTLLEATGKKSQLVDLLLTYWRSLHPSLWPARPPEKKGRGPGKKEKTLKP